MGSRKVLSFIYPFCLSFSASLCLLLSLSSAFFSNNDICNEIKDLVMFNQPPISLSGNKVVTEAEDVAMMEIM